jgi:hypothetical protein
VEFRGHPNYIDAQFMFIRERHQRKELKAPCVPTEKHVAHIVTKAVCKTQSAHLKEVISFRWYLNDKLTSVLIGLPCAIKKEWLHRNLNAFELKDSDRPCTGISHFIILA